jgi:hypothetical protein
VYFVFRKVFPLKTVEPEFESFAVAKKEFILSFAATYEPEKEI